ncbi:MAG: hypothetical protein EZS28_026264 [Streblomastix strix]|uniref:Uncharacterized protein n=1 Tax=Streblomastix strix TaxID=222440 RepID=A0A5J4V785_9EUKA|nr:MAG: hypothetical protein EZS28_026264 [Streblomastix strix]
MEKQQKSNQINVPKLTYEDEVLSFRQTGKIPKQPRLRKYATDEEAKQVAIQQRKICHARYQLQKAQFKQQAEDSQVFAVKRLKKFVITDKKHLEQIHNIIDWYDETMINIKKTIEQGEQLSKNDSQRDQLAILSITLEQKPTDEVNSNDQTTGSENIEQTNDVENKEFSNENVSDPQKKNLKFDIYDIAISEDDCTELLRELRNRYSN